MKPVQDTFTSHIQGLYDGHEVAPPQGMKDAVFNQLDSEVSGSSSGLTSKLILGAAVVIVGFAWFYMPDQDTVVDEAIVVEQVVVSDEIVVSDEVVVADEVIVADEVVVAEEVVVAHVAPVEVENAKTESVEVEENIILSDEVATPPVVDVQKDIEDQKTIEKVEEKKEAVEWVLPAKLKVDE